MSSTSSRTPLPSSSSTTPLSTLTPAIPTSTPDNSLPIGGGGAGNTGGGGSAIASSSGGGATKKKFGKNLNKLNKPPAPLTGAGNASGASSYSSNVAGKGGTGGTSFRGSASSRNGLLLLSTKSKSKTSTGGSGGDAGSGRLLAAAGGAGAKSVHDALLSAVEGRGSDGGGGGKNAVPLTPAAWGGVGEKQPAAGTTATATPSTNEPTSTLHPQSKPPLQQQQQQQQQQLKRPQRELENIKGVENDKPSLVLAPRGGLSKRAPLSGTSVSLDASDERTEGMESSNFNSKKVDAGDQITSSDRVDNNTEKHGAATNRIPSIRPLPRSSYSSNEMVVDQSKNNESQATEKKPDDQVQYMSKLAKERAEKLRSEEEARMMQQKERVAVRLRELEKKRTAAMTLPASSLEREQTRLETKRPSTSLEKELSLTPSATSKTPTILQTRREDVSGSSVRVQISKPSSQIVLEPLGKPKKIASSKTNSKSADAAHGNTDANGSKKLFDPNRTFSSLVGGKSKAHVAASKEEKNKTSDTHSNFAAPRDKRPVVVEPDKVKDELPPIQMIHLNSYDDRDRGGRGTGSGPRMLFDPKSGSMVAVPSREDSTPKSAKKTKQKPRKESDFGTTIQKAPLSKHSSEGGPSRDVAKILLSRRQDDISVNDGDPKVLRKQKGQKEEQSLQRKDKKRMDNEADASDNRGRYGGVGHTPTKQLKQHFRARIPRTCGVLYRMDENGNYVNADKCEADQGFGAHSVPGGRIRNPDAYAKLMEQQEQEQQYQEEEQNDIVSESFSGELNFNSHVRNDPSFLKHQSDFEEQQVRLLEEAWSSLLEEEPKSKEPEVEAKESQEPKPADGSSWAPSVGRFHGAKTEGGGDDEYAAALAISPVSDSLVM